MRFFFSINFPGEVFLSLLFCVLIFDVRLSEAQENNGAPMAFFFLLAVCGNRRGALCV